MHASRRLIRRAAVAVLAIGLARPAPGETDRLPGIEGPEAELASHHESELLDGPELVPPQPPAEGPPSRGLLQWAGVTMTWLPDLAGNDFGMTDVEFKTVLAVPCPTIDWPLVVTPVYGIHYLDGPPAPDLPEQLHNAWLEARWLPLLTPALRADLRVQPGWYSDGETSSSDTFRLGARAVGIYTQSPAVQWVAGGAYLDRNDVPFLPIGGAIWTPNPDTRWEVLFPQPKLAWRIDARPSGETWWYVGGEFGGDQWAILRADGSDDVVTLRDIRLMIGMEQKLAGGSSARVELGYVFDRSIEYESATPDYEPDDTVMVRAELGY
jgi:hypothetical protein